MSSGPEHLLEQISAVTIRDRTLINMARRDQGDMTGPRTVRIVRKEDLIEMKRQAAADPARRRSKALRDLADVELLLGDVPDPDEGW